MKLALGDIRLMKDPMIKLLDEPLPIKIAWKLTKLVKVFDKELGEIEEFRVNLIKKMGVSGEDGSIKVPDDKMEEFIEEFNELLQNEVEVDFEPIEVEQLGDIKIDTQSLIALDKFLV